LQEVAGANVNNELADFLTRLLAIRSSDQSRDANNAIDAYYDFLGIAGVEHCNFGGFEIGADGVPSINQFSGTRLPEPFIEEFTEELAADDYVLRRAELLSEANPFTRFETGLPVLDEIEAFHAPSRSVQVECARHGIEEGMAILGNTSLIAGRPRSETGRYFGFVFGGAKGTLALLEEHGPAFEIAAFSLLDQIMPQVEAAMDGVERCLSPRERDVLAAIARGHIRKQIAFDLNIALPTVDMHINAIKRKLKAATLPEAVARAYRYDML
jgi:DNA-binding CsgD family transcriptional regulator